MPIVILGIVLLAILIITIRYFMIKTINENSDKLVEAEVMDFNKASDELSTNALFAASIVSKLSVVERAYQEYYKTGNLDSSSSLFKARFKHIKTLYFIVALV